MCLNMFLMSLVNTYPVFNIGLPYLLMKKFYKDSFIPHDISADDPHYLQLKKKSLETYYARVSHLVVDIKVWTLPYLSS